LWLFAFFGSPAFGFVDFELDFVACLKAGVFDYSGGYVESVLGLDGDPEGIFLFGCSFVFGCLGCRHVIVSPVDSIH